MTETRFNQQEFILACQLAAEIRKLVRSNKPWRPQIPHGRFAEIAPDGIRYAVQTCAYGEKFHRVYLYQTTEVETVNNMLRLAQKHKVAVVLMAFSTNDNRALNSHYYKAEVVKDIDTNRSQFYNILVQKRTEINEFLEYLYGREYPLDGMQNS